MKILYCEINETPVTVILDSGANCNIIGKSLVDELGLEIDYPHIESDCLMLLECPSFRICIGHCSGLWAVGR